MGTSNSALLRTMAAAREYTADAAGTLDAIQDVITRLDSLQAQLAEQQVDVGEIQSALIAMQSTLAGIVATQGTHTTKLDGIATTQAAHTASLADLPTMKTQIQAIYDAVVTP